MSHAAVYSALLPIVVCMTDNNINALHGIPMQVNCAEH